MSHDIAVVKAQPGPICARPWTVRQGVAIMLVCASHSAARQARHHAWRGSLATQEG